jgi:D-alanine-D-alanine ligase
MTLAALKNGRIGVLLGGTSAEREISLQSGETILRALGDAGLVAFSVDPKNDDWMESIRKADFAYIALHGPGGEDGGMQGTLETLGIPYSGSTVLGSALAMDKVRSKQLWQGIGLPTADFEILSEESDWQQLIDRLGKVFVKPACEGSSIGMRSASTAAELQAAFEEAKKYAGEVMAEQFIDGPEYTVGILGDEALPAIRLETDNDFYDYEAKYLSDDTRYLCPCGLNAEEESQLAQLSLRAFRALDCSVWGRVDLMRHSDGAFYLLEVNTIPGMTSHSLVPMAAREAGLELPELVSRVVALSLGEMN